MIDLVELRAHIAANAEKGIHVAPVVLELIEELEHARGEAKRLREQLAHSPSVVVTQGSGFTDMLLRCERLEEEMESLYEDLEYARGERAAVVAWLRREIQKCGCDDDTAACIERGEHRREEER